MDTDIQRVVEASSLDTGGGQFLGHRYTGIVEASSLDTGGGQILGHRYTGIVEASSLDTGTQG